MREPSPRSRGPLLRPVHRGPRSRSGGALTGIEHAAATGYWDLLRYDGKEEGSKGVLTMGSKRPGSNGMWPAMRM
jgi:hypothetical protein